MTEANKMKSVLLTKKGLNKREKQVEVFLVGMDKPVIVSESRANDITGSKIPQKPLK